MLDQPWITPSEARNGEDCLKAVAHEPPDAIILDLNMPRVGGMEVLEDLRSREETRGLPVIIYTSKSLPGPERHRIEQLHAAFLSKSDVATTLAPEKILNALATVGISQPEKA